MKTQTLKDFLKQFGISWDSLETVLGRSHFIVKERNLLSKHPVFSGEVLAHERGPVLIPSIDLLQRIGKSARHKVTVSSQGEWLFICGRDIFSKSVVSHNKPKLGDRVVICNTENECLGYGDVIASLDTVGKKPVIKRLFDIGDLLRRERKATRRRFST